MASKPRHRTRWIYTDKGDAGTFIRVGYVRNSGSAHEGYAYDCIRLQIKSAWEGQEVLDFCVRLDEASSIATGFSQVVADMLAGKYGRKDVKAHARAVEKRAL